MAKAAIVVVAVVMALGVSMGGCVALVAGSTGSSSGAAVAVGPGASGSPAGSHGLAVPAAWESLAQQAAAAICPGLEWTVLAAIGRVESDSGRSSAPGVASGANSAGAEGPMQFEPGTFAEYATVGPGGADPPSPYDPVDAVYSAAKLLCADGAASASHLAQAVMAYNHSVTYVDTVLVVATALGADPGLDAPAAGALQFAAAQLGVPYRWGGTGPGGFDCSGLVQAAYRAAGIDLPRVAQAQFDAGPQVASVGAAEPGDLVFFGASTSTIDHVGIYVGGGQMIDAPHTGAVVRIESADLSDLVGATRPG
jgi:cell wall-associated NlpC family hydrolase